MGRKYVWADVDQVNIKRSLAVQLDYCRCCIRNAFSNLYAPFLGADFITGPRSKHSASLGGALGFAGCFATGIHWLRPLHHKSAHELLF
jgi:hypothetical protein